MSMFINIGSLQAKDKLVAFVEILRDEPQGLLLPTGPGGGVLPYMGYIGMCGPKGYGF